MIVCLRPAAGAAKDHLNGAKAEMERVVGFRGTVTEVKAEGKVTVAVTVAINPQRDLSDAEKDATLREWIQAKTRKFFKVLPMK